MRKKFTKKKGGMFRRSMSRRSMSRRTRTPKETSLRKRTIFEKIPTDIFIKETNLEVELKRKLIDNY